MTFNSYNGELLLSVAGKVLVLVLVVPECSSSSPQPPPPSTLSSQQLQQQWANRCLRECPLRCPSCQNHPRPWRPQRQLFPGRLRSPHHHPVPFPPHLLPFTREMYITCIALWNKEQQAKKKRHIDQKVGTFIKKKSKCHTSPKHLKITAKRSSRGKWWKH